MSNNNGNGSQNNQAGSHQEGQMRNTPPGSSNHNQGMSDIQPGQQRVSSQEGSETESDRANRNEDEGIRGGNSSI